VPGKSFPEHPSQLSSLNSQLSALNSYFTFNVVREIEYGTSGRSTS